MKPRRRRRLIILTSLLVIFGAGLGFARWYFSGPRLAKFITSVVFGDIRGRMEIGSVDWPFGGLFSRRLPVVIKDVKIYAPDHTTLVLDIPEITATVDWPSVVLPGHDLIVSDIKINKGYAYIQSYPTPDGPYPSEIGFIAALEPKHHTPSIPGAPVNAPLIELADLTLSGVHLELHFPGWSAVVEGLSASGTLRQKTLGGGKMDFVYMLDPRAERAHLDLGGQQIELVNFEAHRFGQYPVEKDALAFNLRADTVEGAALTAEGKLADLYNTKEGGSLDVTIEVRRAAKLLERVSLGYAGGDAAARLRVTGKMHGPRLDVTARGATVHEPIVAQVDHAEARLDLGTGRVDLTRLDVRALGGRVEVTGHGSVLGRAVNEVSVAIDRLAPINLAAYLPPEIVKEAGSTRLSGKVHARGVVGAFEADRIDANLGRIAVRGNARLLGDDLRTRGLEVSLPEARATLRGSFGLATGKLNLDFDASSPKVEVLLARLQLPALATSVVAKGKVTGTTANPAVTADATVLGAPYTPRLTATVGFKNRELTIERLVANPLGGTVSGGARVRLGRVPEILNAKLDAADLDVRRLGIPVGGLAKISLTGRGTLARPHADLTLTTSNLSFARRALGEARAEVTVDPLKGVNLKTLTITGAAGTLAVNGTIGLDRAHTLDLHVGLDAFPLAAVPALTGAADGLALAGTATLQAHLTGTLLAPLAQGELTALGLRLLDTSFGDTRLSFEPTADGRIRFHGKLIRGALDVDGTFALVRGKPSLALRASFDQVDLEEFLPEVAAQISARCQVTGYLTASLDPALTAELHLSQVRFDLQGPRPEREDMEPLPMRVENKGEIAIAYDGANQRATFLSPMRFVSPSGELNVSGFAGMKEIDLRIAGEVQLGLIEFYLRRYVDRAGGTVLANLVITGDAQNPLINGEIAMKDATMSRREAETEVRLPEGKITFSNNRVDVRNIILDVDGERMIVVGNLDLVSFRPTRLDARLGGRLSGKLLEIFIPEAVHNASGSAQVSLAVTGNALSPDFQGTLVIDRPLALTPRVLRKEITLNAGVIRFNNQQVSIDRGEKITGVVDDGRLEVNGDMVLANYAPVAMSVTLGIDGYAHRLPNVLAIEVNGNMTLAMRHERLYLSGKIEVVDGAYVASIPLEGLIVPTRTVERSDPFWKTSPMLANMALDLRLTTNGEFEVHNQMARDISLAGEVFLRGTPERPIFDGQVRVDEGGAISIPFTKAGQFTVRYGSVSFSPYRAFPEETPYVSIRADAPYVDYDQTEHTVFLELTGTLSGFQWQLSTNTGLNKAQTFSLITTGRTPDALRAKARGDASGGSASSDPFAASAGGSGSSAVVAVSDQFFKDLSREFISVLIEDPVKNFIGLDCFHFGVGTGSITSSLCLNLSANLVLNAEFEEGFNWYRRIGSANLKAADDLFLVLQGSSIKSAQEAEGVQNALRLQLKYRFVIP